MLSVSDAAVAQLDEYFADKERAPIRVYLSSGGCSGPRLALALDEAGDGDETVAVGSYSFLIDKELAQAGAPFSIDMTPMGFVIGSTLEFPQGGGCGCSGGCGGGSGGESGAAGGGCGSGGCNC